VLVLAVLGLALFQVVIFFTLSQNIYLPGPVQDSWGLMPYIERTLYSGNWFNAELLVPQNSHRYPFLKLSYLIDFYYFQGSNLFLILETVLLISCTVALYYFALFRVESGQDTSSKNKLLIFLCIACFLTFPTLIWSISHIFNIHMVQCAFFALLACFLLGHGLNTQKNMLIAAGFVAVIACNLSTFTLSSIWPAIVLLFWFNGASFKKLLAIFIAFCLWAVIFIYLLPVESDIAGQNYSHFIQLSASSSGGSFDLFGTIKFALFFLVSYLSLPKFFLGDVISGLITLASLIWFLVHITFLKSKNTHFPNTFNLAVMCFVIFLGLTTALGRGFMGELSYGLRFHPMILLYWASFCFHLLYFLKQYKTSYFNIGATVFVVYLFSASIPNAVDMNKRLSEDFNRFAKAKTSYLNNNLHPNAVYENLVESWRQNSYPGIIATIPFLKENALGVYALPLNTLIQSPISKETSDSCLTLNGVQKVRAKDPLIRNLVLSEKDSQKDELYPYLLIYKGDQLFSILFQQRRSMFQTKHQRQWTGVSPSPVDAIDDLQVLAISPDMTSCPAELEIIQSR